MSNVRQHLAAMHKGEHAHHIKSAARHLKMATHFAKAADALGRIAKPENDEDSQEAYKTAVTALHAIATAFNESAIEHDGMSKLHADAKESCEKATGDEDLNKLAPTGISAVYDPSKAPQNLRMVARAGAPTIPASMTEAPKVEPIFENLVKTVDDDRFLEG